MLAGGTAEAIVERQRRHGRLGHPAARRPSRALLVDQGEHLVLERDPARVPVDDVVAPRHELALRLGHFLLFVKEILVERAIFELLARIVVAAAHQNEYSRKRETRELDHRTHAEAPFARGARRNGAPTLKRNLLGINGELTADSNLGQNS